MNNIKVLFIIALTLSAHLCAADTTRVLWIGNSYTNMTFSMPSITGNMAAQRNIPYYYKNSIKGGRGWEAHWNEDTVALNLIKSGNWDYVVLQDISTGALESNWARFLDYGKRFTAEVYKAGAKPILYVTWAYENRVPKFDSVNNLWLPSMYDTIQRNYYRLADSTNSYVAPVGIVHEAVWKEYGGIDLWSDGTHPNAAGANISAGTHFATLFGETAKGLNIVKYGTSDVPDSALVRFIHGKIDSVIQCDDVKRYLPQWNRPDVVKTRFIHSSYSMERLNKIKVSLETVFSDSTRDTASNKFVFTMLDTSVAKIDYTGLITGIAPGITRLVARRKSAIDTVTINVSENSDNLDSLKLSFNRYTILSSDTFQLDASGYFSNDGFSYTAYCNRLVTWTASDTSLVDLSNGTVIGKKRVGTVLITASYSGVQDTCRMELGPKLDFALRINFQASATPYNFGWRIDNVTQGYSGDNILGWQNHSSMYSYDDRLGENYLLKTLTMPYSYGTRNYRIKAPSGSYIIKIAMGDNKNGTGTNTIWTRYGEDTLISHSGMGNNIKVDTINVVSVNGMFDLNVKGQINYLVLISNEGVDINDVAWDEGVRIAPFTVSYNPPVVFAETNPVSAISSLSCSVFPNPFNPHTTIRLDGVVAEKGAKMKITDINGRVVADFGLVRSRSINWDAAEFPAGLYILKITGSGTTASKRLVLTK